MPRSQKSTIKFNPLEKTSPSRESKGSNKQATPKKVPAKRIATRKNQDLNITYPANKLATQKVIEGDSDNEERDLKAIQTIKKWSRISSAFAVAPLPLFATVTSASIQIKMIKDLCSIYKVPFRKELVVATLKSILGSGATLLSLGFLGKEALKGVPYLGNALLVITQPAAIYKLTYALGVIFMRHFQNRGDLTNVNLEESRSLLKKKP